MNSKIVRVPVWLTTLYRGGRSFIALKSKRHVYVESKKYETGEYSIKEADSQNKLVATISLHFLAFLYQ